MSLTDRGESPLLIAAYNPCFFPKEPSLMWIFRDCVLGVLGQEEVDARRARHVHRNAVPKVTVSVLHAFYVKSPNVFPGFGASSPRPRTAGSAAGVPPRGCGRRRQPPPTPLPRPLRRRLSTLPRSPAPARRGSCGVRLAGASGRKGYQV